jgi:hypothetical protein
LASASPHDRIVIEIHWLQGKSYWIFYALRRRLAEGKPVIWYRGSMQFLFVKDGVYEAPKGFRSTRLKTRVWTLVDADQLEGIPPELAVQQTKHLNIFTTSLESKRWKPLEKTTVCGVFIMNPWTRKELLQAFVPPVPFLFKLIICFVQRCRSWI